MYLTQHLARQHPNTLFLKADVNDTPFLVEKLGIQVLPCLLAFVNGVCKERFVGFEEFGNADNFTTAALEWRLGRVGTSRDLCRCHYAATDGQQTDPRLWRATEAGRGRRLGRLDHSLEIRARRRTSPHGPCRRRRSSSPPRTRSVRVEADAVGVYRLAHDPKLYHSIWRASRSAVTRASVMACIWVGCLADAGRALAALPGHRCVVVRRRSRQGCRCGKVGVWLMQDLRHAGALCTFDAHPHALVQRYARRLTQPSPSSC